MVIGTLIALFIGNWKEQRADSRKRELLLKTLKSEFASDFLSLHRDLLFEDFLGERQFNMRDAVHELYLV